MNKGSWSNRLFVLTNVQCDLNRFSLCSKNVEEPLIELKALRDRKTALQALKKLFLSRKFAGKVSLNLEP